METGVVGVVVTNDYCCSCYCCCCCLCGRRGSEWKVLQREGGGVAMELDEKLQLEEKEMSALDFANFSYYNDR